jgi:hypothetical protein
MVLNHSSRALRNISSSTLANFTATTTDLPGLELDDPLSEIGRMVVVGKGRVPGNVEDDAEGRNIGSKQSSCQCMLKQVLVASLPGLGFEDSCNALKVRGSKLLSKEGKGITPVEIDTRERALSSCSDICKIPGVWRHRALVCTPL